MKKLTTTLLLLVAINFYSQAQWVSIPDTNFGKWLNTNGYTSCIQGNSQVGWQMDTTCPAIVNEDSLNCYDSEIKLLTGLEYFSNLHFLNTSINPLTSNLPSLPSTLTYLLCDYNQLTGLPSLPNSLLYLSCRSNDLTNLPSLPNSLLYLNCVVNQLTTLPALPNALNRLECMVNQLTSLPALPDSLTYLHLYSNQLTSLPALPSSLRDLFCGYNPITSLPVLPVGLTTLACAQSQLTSLPVLPDSLRVLACFNNQLTSLPLLPNNLYLLSCHNNQLSSIVDLPNSLLSFACYNNQLNNLPELPDSLTDCRINDNPISCLPRLTRIGNLDFSNTLVTCKSNYGNVTTSTPSLASLPLCQPGNPNGCASDSFCFGFQIDSITITNTSCAGVNDGSACVYVSGGTPTYSYLWSNGAVSIPCLDSLIATVPYGLTVTDLNGCSVSNVITIPLSPQFHIDSITTTNVSCFGRNDGTVTLYLNGGVPPYSYSIDGGIIFQSSSTFTGLNAGSYTITFHDSNGCSGTQPFIITEPPMISVTRTTVDATCGLCNGEVSISISGGVPPYWPSVHDSVSVICLSGNCSALCGGNQYLVIVTDDNACSDSSYFAIGQSLAPVIDSVTTTSVSCFGGSDGSACVYASGGTLPYAYYWDIFNTAQCISPLVAGSYTVIVSDLNGCSVSGSQSITEPTQLTAQFVYSTDGVLPDTVFCYVAGGTPSYTTDWGDGAPLVAGDSVVHIYNISAIYNPIVTDSNGCQVRDTLEIGCFSQCVWPGDADHNGIADNNDLLPIGLGFGTIGTPRTQQDINWYAHSAIDWTDTLLSGTNYKHIDCNGNGTVNADDTLAILQNFGLLHAKTDEQRDWRMTDPAFYVDLTPDTTHAGDTMYANLTLGDINVPANDVYGLAFTLNYDAAVVDSSKTKITFGNSWLGTDTDKISIDKNFHPTGQLKCAITRIDHATRSGFGQIGQAEFVITTDNINGKTYAYYPMNVWITDLVMIDNLGNYITVNEGIDSSLVEFEPTAVGEIRNPQSAIRIAPNPANDEVQIIVTEELIGGEFKVLDVEGRVLLQTVFTTRHLPLTTRHFAQGIYFVQVRTQNGMLTKRLVIAR